MGTAMVSTVTITDLWRFARPMLGPRRNWSVDSGLSHGLGWGEWYGRGGGRGYESYTKSGEGYGSPGDGRDGTGYGHYAKGQGDGYGSGH